MTEIRDVPKIAEVEIYRENSRQICDKRYCKDSRKYYRDKKMKGEEKIISRSPEGVLTYP